MTTFTLTIALGNTAMQSPEDVADALLTLAQRLGDACVDNESAFSRGVIRDVNGNVVGWWSFE